MSEFKTNFQSVQKDIERWMQRYGTPGTLPGGTPCIWGGRKAEEFVFHLYFEHEAWDALVDHFSGATEWSTWPELLRLRDLLVERRDVRRLKRCWRNMLAEQKLAFWELHAFCRRGRSAVAGSLDARFYSAESEESLLRRKKRLLESLDEAYRMMANLGETSYAGTLREDYQSIEQETRGKKLPKPVDRSIDESVFWELIETAKRASESEAEQMELLVSALESSKASEIKKFRSILDAQLDALFHWDVWALAFLALGGSSDDGFDYFREWLVLQGKQIVTQAQQDVQQLVDLPSGRLQVEGLRAVPEVAYENRSGKPLRPAKRKPAQLKGEAWEESELQSRYPRLYARYA
jgi:hypothetical protein